VEQVTGQKKRRKEKMKNKKKSASIRISGYDQMKFKPLCTSKLQTFENLLSQFAAMAVQSLKFSF